MIAGMSSMTAPSRLARFLGPPVPARDVPFVDALAVLVGLSIAYAARAATSATYPLAWSGVEPYVRHALPLCVAAVLLAAAATGLYGAGAASAGLREHAVPVAYATALVGVAGTVWGGPFPPTFVLLPGFVATVISLYSGRRLYWTRLAGRPEEDAARPAGQLS